MDEYQQAAHCAILHADAPESARPGIGKALRVRTNSVRCNAMSLPCKLRSALLSTLAAALAGCAPAPGFTTRQPESVAVGGAAIAVIGDLQQTPGFVRMLRRREDTSEDQLRLIADLDARVEGLAALVIVGDLVYSGRSRRDWLHFDELMTPIAGRVPILPAIGNHDYPCYLIELCRTGRLSRGMQARFPWLSPGKPYLVAADDVVMMFLDSESRLDEQSEWLRRQLEMAARRFRAALVFYHRPGLSSSLEKTAQGNPEIAQTVVPALSNAPLPTIVFNGHIHGFEHFLVGKTHFVTTAGGGGPRVAMPAAPETGLYSGPQCLQLNGNTLRPFNYVLVRRRADSLAVEVRGFCRGDDSVRDLYRFDLDF